MDVGRPDTVVKTSDYRLSYYQTIDVDADGKFSFDGVPAGKYALTAELDPKSGFYTEKAWTLDLAPGAAVDNSKLSIRRGVRIQGRVLDQVTKAPVAGVDLAALCTVGSQRQWVGNAKTDAEGKYTLYARPGQISVFIQSVPKGYPRPTFRGDESGREVTGDCAWDDIFLEPAKLLKGIVVDPSGKPVAGAKIFAVARDGHFQNPCATSDAQGEFALEQLQPNKQVWLHATTETAVTADPLTFTPADIKDPVKLTVAEASACRLRGTAVDEQGNPIVGAKVAISATWMVANWGIGFVFELTTTDTNGAFVSPALPPGISYRAVLTALGREKRETAEAKLEPAQTRECGSVVLRGTQRFVEGTVVDSAGQPVPDAEVFNRGDSPKKVATRTDAKGHFRLEGLYTGQVWVFVQKEGCRFTGAQVAADRREVSLTLLRRDEPIPPAQRPKEPTAEEEQAVARQIADKFWAICKTPEMKQGVIQYVESIDPEKARQWRESLGETKPAAPQMIPVPETADLVEVAKTDVDEALTLVAERDAKDALRQLQALARQFKDSDAEKAARFAEEALVRARALDQPDRSCFVAELGNLLVELGEADAGRKVLDEAVEMTSSLAATGKYLNARLRVARLLAGCDADRAMTLLDPIKENERDHYRCQVAIAVAKKDPQKAVQLIAKTSEWYQNRARKQIAFDVAPKDAKEAIAIIEQMPATNGQDAIRDKAEGLGWLAIAIAPQDKPLACSLIDRALDLCLQESETFRYGNGGRCQTAAVVAGQAKYIDYPDMESTVCRVMAARPSESDTWSPREGLRDLGGAAVMLSAVDRQAARQILEALEPKGEASPQSDPNDYESRQRFLAWVLVDLDRALKMAEAEIATLASNPELDPRASRLAMIFQVLSKSPKDRLEYVAHYVGNVWFPGEN
jgi:protocatechuate 3,4-dioxygenase beta subunit